MITPGLGVHSIFWLFSLFLLLQLLVYVVFNTTTDMLLDKRCKHPPTFTKNDNFTFFIFFSSALLYRFNRRYCAKLTWYLHLVPLEDTKVLWELQIRRVVALRCLSKLSDCFSDTRLGGGNASNLATLKFQESQFPGRFRSPNWTRLFKLEETLSEWRCWM